MISDKIRVIMPKKNIEEILTKIQKSKNTANLKDSITLYKNQNNGNAGTNKPNQKRLSYDNLNKILKDNNYIELKTEDIFKPMMDISAKLYDNLKELEEKDGIIFKNEGHFEKMLEKYYNKIYKSDIVKELENMNLNVFNYLPFGDYNGYPKFLNFLYRTWELLSISAMFNNNTGEIELANKLMEDYYINTYTTPEEKYEILLSNYLKDYQQYDCIRFNLIEMRKFGGIENIRDENNKEYFTLVLGTEELAVPIIFELKKELCSLINGKKYFICKYCHKVVIKNSSNQYSCGSVDCTRARDAEEKRNQRAKLKNMN